MNTTTTFFRDDIVNGNVVNVRKKLCANPSLVQCIFHDCSETQLGDSISWTESPLNLAARKGQADVVKLLLEYDADIHHLSTCHMKFNYSFSENIEADGPPLYWACQANKDASVEVAETLLDAGADLYMPCVSRDDKGIVTLKSSYSVAGSFTNNGLLVKRLLLARGFNPNSTQEDDKSLLHIAALHGCIQEMKILVAAGATVNNPGTYPSPIMHLALFSTKRKLSEINQICHILLCAGADINEKNSAGETLLHRAVDSPNVYRLLLKFGGDELLRNKRGDTALLKCCGDFMLHKHIPWMVDAATSRAALQARTCDMGFYPFQQAALYGPGYPYDKCTLTASFLLLRADPTVLFAACTTCNTKKDRLKAYLVDLFRKYY